MLSRRAFAARLACVPLAAPAISPAAAQPSAASGSLPWRIKLSCNLYSFNAPLTRGEMTLDGVLEYCAALGFEAVDPTGYYFTGYPAPPADEAVYRIKRGAFRLGLDISGTGVRNDFALRDAAQRKTEIDHVVRWVDVAARLGAPVLRVFAGREVPAGDTERQVLDRVVESLRPCVEHGARRGVMIVLQNHHDALKTAGQVLEVLRRVDSEWFGLNVDVGSLRMSDPYADIALLAPHACTWQLKEEIYRGDRAEKTDVARVFRIMRDAAYRGYVPIETLGPGDPRQKLRRFLDEVRAALASL